MSHHPAPSSPPDPAKLTLAPNECQTVTLSDSRTLGFATYGSTDPTHPAIFLFHGMPGCRIDGRSFDKICHRIGARLITIDRPGNGLSKPAPDRGLTDWPEDVLTVADHLGIQKFSVVGASGGGPFALACARFIPRERLRGTTVVCGIGPVESLVPWRLMGLTTWSLRCVARYIILPSIVAPYIKTRYPSDLKRIVEDQCKTPEEKAMLHDTSRDTTLDDVVAGLLETFKQGAVGVLQDGSILAGDWGFDLTDVDSERIWLWHGDQDATAPVRMAKFIDAQLGGGRLKILEGKTHFTIWKDHAEEIFRQSAEA